MSGTEPPSGGMSREPIPGQSPDSPREARIRHRRFSAIWLIPIVAALVTGYLGWRTFSDRGPLITVSFGNADGLTAGQTPVRYKSVQVGMVEAIHLTEDLRRVETRIRMDRAVGDHISDHSRFWVVRPRFTGASVSGLETIVSGSYIEFDPGEPGTQQRRFTGLENPPGRRSDEPGRDFVLRARRLGPIDRGSPVFFRDVEVGQVLSYNPPGIDGSFTLHIFVRAPYSDYVRKGSRFWNASGVNLRLGAEGVRLELESARALLAGGIAFDTPSQLRDQPPAPEEESFTLYSDLESAIAATSENRLAFLVYFDGSVRGLSPGAPALLRGIRIGSVLDVNLEYDQQEDHFRVPVHIAIEPDRISFPAGRPTREVRAMAEEMVAKGLRAQLISGSLLTGQLVVSMDFMPDAPPAQVRMQGEEIVLPSIGGGTDNIMAAVSNIAGKLDRFPIEEIGRNLNGALASVNGVVGGPELRNALNALSSSLGSARDLIRKADGGMTPLLRRLPAIADNLDQTVAHASTAIRSIERGYGGDSEVNREMERLMSQLTDTARSIRLLADFLNRHPEALIRGRTGAATER
ncbi:MlaD family protein [Roseomonas gilardii subsp. gilardii]|uniref:PqiB family protein n=1 Tax=Roseomonas gilardii TaxID=257708 RepID=UPI001FFBB213|nr:MlaD family protein [Roseomonas gilardii]UPG72061.1 MlaD family protein [Roseomonas gilardii subsp. gilardii]